MNDPTPPTRAHHTNKKNTKGIINYAGANNYAFDSEIWFHGRRVKALIIFKAPVSGTHLAQNVNQKIPLRTTTKLFCVDVRDQP